MSEEQERPPILSTAKQALLALRLKRAGLVSAAQEERVQPRPAGATPLPLSFAQQRLWLIEQMAPGLPLYHMPLGLRMRGQLAIRALEQSLQALLARHESLRTTFATAEGRPVQVVQPAPAAVALVRVDLTAQADPWAAALQMAQEAARRPFDLTSDLPMRAHLWQTGEQEHLLLLTLHHIAGDGWSIGVLLREVAALYGAFAAGEAPALPPLAVQYADFALWQRAWLQGARWQQQLAYWQERLAHLPQLELPTDRPRPAVQAHGGATHAFALSAAHTKALQALSEREGATLFMTLLAAFQVLLYRYTGQVDFGVGVPVANRNRFEVQGLIGFFVNTLVMRSDLAGLPTFRQLLARVRAAALEAYGHQDLPFEALVEALQPERSLSQTPLIQAFFVLQNAPLGAVALPGLALEPVEVSTGTARFDLTLSMQEGPAGLTGVVEYRTALFASSTIARLTDHFATLLAAIAADPDQPVAYLPVLTPAEQAQQLHGCNDTVAPLPKAGWVHAQVAAQAARQPDGLAIVAGAERLTYGELNRRANQLAHLLRRRGVGPEVVVGLYLERSPAMLVGCLAILKAGGAYLPLDTASPPERLAGMIGDAQVSLLLTEARLAAALRDVGAAHICLDGDALLLAGESEAEPDCAVGDDTLAYLIYTSGSTGRPKAVQVEHGSLCNLLHWYQRRYRLMPGDRTTHLAGVTFDAAVWEIWPALAAGACLYLPDEQIRIDSVALRDWLVAEQITVSFAPTPLAEALLALDWPPEAALRVLQAGGDRLHSYRPTGLPFALHNLYGPTENTVCATAAVVPERGEMDGPPSIGRPIDGVRAYVLDHHLQLVPVGVSGELYLGGAGVARGYAHRPDLTAERFLPDPFGPHGSRLYRTGDRVRYLPNGEIDFLGRSDQQVKIRGFRIELGEVEAALAQHGAVSEAVVVAQPGPSGAGARLVAYLVWRAAALGQRELRAFLSERLPDYMIPAAFVQLEQLPLTPHGKVDRRALPAPDDEWLAPGAAYVAPATPVEELLAAIWADLLGVARVGRTDDFFALGGNSLLAAQLMARLRAALQVDLTLRHLFEAPTLAALAARLTASAQAERPVPPLVPRDRQRPLPLSSAQQQLWFLTQYAPDSPVYNVPAAVRLQGRLDVAALERSLQAVLCRHEVLRTTYTAVDGRPQQVIHAADNFRLPLIDLRETPHAETTLSAMLQRFARTPIPLAGDAADEAQGNLIWRTQLLRVADEEHLLLLTMHHIATDGWSLSILAREVAAFYAAFAAGERPALPELPVQYADYAIWQQQQLQGEGFAQQLAYWQAHLAGFAGLLELPADRPRPTVQRFAGASVQRMLPADLTERLSALCRRAGVTRYMALLAAFQALLYRYTGQEDIGVASPFANRTQPETEGLVGFFVNTLVMRTSLSGNPTFGQLLQRVREVTLGAHLHQELPFERLVDALQPARDPSRNPLVQVMFALQNAPFQLPTLPGLTLSPVAVDGGISRFDLNLDIAETPNGLVATLTYNTDLFDADRSERMLTHLQRLLEGALNDPTQPLSALPVLSEAEEERALFAFNQTEQDFPYTQVHTLFELRAAHMGDAVAALFEGQRISYRELNERANQLAHHLIARGVGPEMLVGISMERSLRMLVAVLGVLKAGGAYVPIDPTYPPERLAYLLADAQVEVLLTQKRLADQFATGPVQVIALDADWRQIAKAPTANPAVTMSPENLAYVIYTSGSTGQPKGVMIEHRAVCNFVNTVQQRFTISPADRVLQFASLSFDVSVFEIFGALLTGATLVLARHESLIDPEALTHLLRAERVTITDMPPAMMALLDAERFPALRIAFVGGEPFSGDLVNRWQLPGRRFFNGYGPTEATVTVIIKECPGLWRQSPPIGVPMANHQAYVLDRHLQPVPVGVPGELYIGGVGLARGYLRRPGLTAERFLSHPWSQAPGARLYRTGDLVRYLPNGDLEFVGRADDQVKMRGFRIELGEIEAALAQHAAVRQAAVLLRTDPPGEKRLVAYVAGERSALHINELRQHLSSLLPAYMLPAAFVLLDQLPLNASGKVDRRALPAPDAERPALAEAYAAPRSEIEQLLTSRVFGQVLGLEQVGIHDNFFELGGNSLQATQVLSRVRETFQVDLPLRSLFEGATVAEVAQSLQTILQAAPAAAERAALPRIDRRSRPAEIPLSYAQQRLWFIHQLSAGRGPDDRSLQPNDVAYHIPAAVRLTGRLDAGALAQSLRALVERHESLRTTFATVEGRPVQLIHEAPAFELPLIELAGPDAPEQALALARTEALRPFDLGADLMLRATLLRLGEEEHLLLVTMHHIAGDGWSTAILMREVAALYAAFAARNPSPLPALPIQYADFAIAQREWLQGERREAQLAYWRDRLAGLAPLQLLTDRPRPAVQSVNGATVPFWLADALRSALNTLSQGEGATLFMTLLAAFQTLLYRYTGQTDIGVGVPIANRNWAETEGLIGFFVNTLVMRSDLANNPTFRQLLAQVREVALGAYQHQDLPFEELVRALQPERSLSHTPLFQVAFALQNAPAAPLQLEGLTLQLLDIDLHTAKFDLLLTITEGEAGLHGAFTYNTDLFDAATIAGMTSHFATLLTAIAADPDQPLSRLPLLTAAEQQALLQPPAPFAIETHAPVSLHGRFAAQAARQPSAIALCCGDQQLTYGELNQRADRLAQELRQHGVGPEVLVGICMERSIELIVGLLAILKAGGAYLPLDPAYPAERIRFTLQDAGAPLLLTAEGLQALQPERPAPAQRQPCADDLAYVIYTSGSTGTPKGVQVTQANVTRLFDATHHWFGFNERDVWTLFHSITFDFSVWEIWGALLYGGRLVIVPYMVSRDAEAFVALLRQERVTVLNQTPSAFRQLSAADAAAGPHTAPLSLRYIIFGGEALDLQSLRPWFERHGDREPQLVNMYGITETTVHVTYRPISWADLEAAPGSMIGEPIPDLQIYLLDQHQQPVPIGVPGEIYVGGAGVVRGYLNRPALTAERFVTAPVGRLYRTGDLARRLPNGDLEYRGRIDQQVKMRGFRIELGEIEAALMLHPAVQEAVVIDRTDATGHRYLAAYLVSAAGGVAPDWRRFLQERLPDYMIPAYFVPLESIPLTINGKVDRRALPDPTREYLADAQRYVAPETEAQELLAQIWCAVLGLERVSIDANFFDLGGDSIRSIQLRAKVREQGFDFGLQHLFQHPTIRDLAGLLTAAGDAQAAAPFGLIAAADRERLPADVVDAYPLTALQAGMLFHRQYQPASALYHEITSFHLKTPFDEPAMALALQRLIERHDTLRTAFAMSGYSAPLQLVYRTAPVPLQVADLRHLPAAEQEAALTACVNAEKRRGFAIDQPPLLRFWMHRRSAERFQFTLSCHHAILDGWSVASMLTELFREYGALRRAESLQIEPPASKLRQFVALERQSLADAAAEAYWAKGLSDLNATRLPRLPFAAAEAQAVGVMRLNRDLPAATLVGLERLAHLVGAPLKSVLLAAHLRVLSLLSGQRDVLTGLVSNGRPEEVGGERVLGLFLNTLPLRMQLLGGTWLDLVRQCYAAEQALLPFRRYPLAQLQQRYGGREPLFEVAFNYIHFHVYHTLQAQPDLEVLDQFGFEQTSLPFVVQFSRSPAGGGLMLNLAYDPAQFDAQQVEHIAGYYAAAVERMAAAPEERYEQRALLGEAEVQQMQAWNITPNEIDMSRCTHELVQEQAARTPDGIALVCRGQRLTYAELNRWANQLAHYLRQRGVGPEVPVCICAERSIEMIVGQLAILKAGGAFVPLDPAHPTERLRYMLQDAKAPVLLTQERLADRFAGCAAHLFCLDRDRTQLAGQPAANPVSGVEARNLAYIIYTSGSTGQPKGVQAEHRGLLSLIRWHQRTSELTPTDRTTQLAGVGFDSSGWDIWPTLTCGACLYLPDEETRLQPLRLRDWLLTEQITVSFVPTPMAEALLALDWPPETALRILHTGGDKLHGYPSAPLPFRLVNNYGPTENTICSTYGEVVSQPATGGAPSIGRPNDNVRAYILDHALQQVPVGTPGELYLGGLNVTRGYVGRPDLTAARFVPDPFAGAGGRLYQTGDLVRFLPNGEIDFLGRIDQQVKIRGFRIELGEIESALTQHPAVREAVVIARHDLQGAASHGPALVAYITAAAGDGPPAPQELRTFLQQRLPDYMLPVAYIALAALPLNVNGKIDRGALPAPTASANGREYLAPRDALEAQIAAIWAEVLGDGPIGVQDDFFAIGGHSLLAARLIARLEEALGRQMPLAQLYQGATVERMAAALRQPAERSGPLVCLQPAGAAPPLYLVHGVEGTVLAFAELVRELGAERPLYGLQSIGLDAQQEPLTTVAAMAERYVAAIREVQPVGPYHLVGYSMGGAVAVEMARRLLDGGEMVGFLALLDARAAVPDAEVADYADALAGSEAWHRVLAANVAAARQHRLAPYAGPALLVQAGSERGAERAAWEAVITGGLRCAVTPGDHASMLKVPHVAGLAALLRGA